MLDYGAAIIDVGGESTRPGSDGVTADEELGRIEQVLLDLSGAPVSVDTSKAVVAHRALELGVELVNDVTALRGDPELAGVVADAGCYLCLMHMQGEPRTMQIDPTYDDVVSDVKRFSRSGLHSRSRPACARSSSVWTRGSASARRLRTTSSSCADCTSSRRSGGPCSSGSRARALWASSRATRREGRFGRGVCRRRGQRIPSRGVHSARARRAGARGGAGRREGGGRMIVELAGSRSSDHGVEEEEQRLGQLFLFDVQLEVGDRGATDRLGDAVDYTHVAPRDPRALRPGAFRSARGARHSHRRHAAWSVSRPSRCASACASRRSNRPASRSSTPPSPSSGRDGRVRRARLESRRSRVADPRGRRADRGGRLSTIIETEPWGYEQQPRFLNAVAEVETPLAARAFLEQLLDVERRLGRERAGRPWGPRTIDLDLLLFGDEELDEPGLVVPASAPRGAVVRARAAGRARSVTEKFPVPARSRLPSQGYNQRGEPPRRARRVRGRGRAASEEGVRGGLFPLPVLRPHPGCDVPLQQAGHAVRPAAELSVLPSEDGGRLGLGQEPADADDPARRGVHVQRRDDRGAAGRRRRAGAHRRGARQAHRRGPLRDRRPELVAAGETRFCFAPHWT